MIDYSTKTQLCFHTKWFRWRSLFVESRETASGFESLEGKVEKIIHKTSGDGPGVQAYWWTFHWGFLFWKSYTSEHKVSLILNSKSNAGKNWSREEKVSVVNEHLFGDNFYTSSKSTCERYKSTNFFQRYSLINDNMSYLPLKKGHERFIPLPLPRFQKKPVGQNLF